MSISSKIHKYSIFHNVSFVVSKQYECFLCTKVASLGYHSLVENFFKGAAVLSQKYSIQIPSNDFVTSISVESSGIAT